MPDMWVRKHGRWVPRETKLVRVGCFPGWMPDTWREREFCREPEHRRKLIWEWHKSIAEITESMRRLGWVLRWAGCSQGEEIRRYEKNGLRVDLRMSCSDE